MTSSERSKPMKNTKVDEEVDRLFKKLKEMYLLQT